MEAPNKFVTADDEVILSTTKPDNMSGGSRRVRPENGCRRGRRATVNRSERANARIHGVFRFTVGGCRSSIAWRASSARVEPYTFSTVAAGCSDSYTVINWSNVPLLIR
jgi:hypothetical protein